MMIRLFLTFVLPLICESMDLCEYLNSIGQPWGSPSCMKRGSTRYVHPLQLPRPFISSSTKSSRSITVTPFPVLITPPKYIGTTPSTLENIIRSVERIEKVSGKSLSLLKSIEKPICPRLKQSKCESDASCSSGIGCIHIDIGTPCCFTLSSSSSSTQSNNRFRKFKPTPVIISTTTESSLQCPKPNSSCPAKGSICQSTSDCFNPSASLCCDSGCGYKICSRGQFDDTKYPLIDPRSPRSICPSLDNLQLKCNKKGGISWCSNDAHCQVPGSDLVKRHCCPTQCAYNVCISQHGSQIIIG